MATIIGSVNGNLLKYINGATIATAKTIIKGCPVGVIQEFLTLCMFNAATTRRAVTDELNAIINANHPLENYIRVYCSIEGERNNTLLTLIGFIALASDFANTSAFKTAFATRFGNSNVYNANFNLGALNAGRREIIQRFKAKFTEQDFTDAVNKLTALVDGGNTDNIDAARLHNASTNAAW
jgi:hypothetical protein